MTNEEKDIHLAVLAGEHVHKWLLIAFHPDDNIQENKDSWQCDCDEYGSTEHFGYGLEVSPPAATPRAHSTDELLDYADEKEYDVSMLTVAGKGVTQTLQNLTNNSIKYRSHALYSDHPPPGHARRHALYQAIIEAMEVKK